MPRRRYIILSLLFSSTIILGLLFSTILTNPINDPLPTLASIDGVYSPNSAEPMLDHPAIPSLREVNAGQEIIIQFVDSASPPDWEQILLELNAELVQEVPQIQGAVIVSSERITPEQIENLSTTLRIESNYPVQSLLTFPTNDPLIGEQWALEAIDVASLWETSANTDVIIAVIDSGVCFNHSDLQGRFLSNGFDFIDNDDSPTDAMGHGCAISGIIAANANNNLGIAGVAPIVNILPIRVLDENGAGTYANVISAIYYAVDAGADILNLSLGGQNHSEILEQAVNYAVANGVDVVAGTGNTGQIGVLYPAHYANVIAVGSHDINGNRSTFSTYGNEVDTLAPGENILTTSLNGDYGRFTGTSMAVPHVSGLLALSRTSGQAIDLANIMNTPVATDNNVVEALNTSTPSQTPLAPISGTSTSTSFQCSDLQLTEIEFFPGGNGVDFYLMNSGSETVLESVEFHFPNSPAPAPYLNGLFYIEYVDPNNSGLTYQLWDGDSTSVSPLYIDKDVPSPDFPDTDYWGQADLTFPANSIRSFQALFVNVSVPLSDYWTNESFTGTKFSFYNPSDPQTPCVINVPEDLEIFTPTPTLTSVSPTNTPTPTFTPAATPISCENYAGTYTLGTIQSNLESDLRRSVECANQSVEDNIINLNGQTVSFDDAPSNYDYVGFNALEPIAPVISAGWLTIQNGTIERNNGISLCETNVVNRSLFRLLITQPDSHLTLSNVTIKNGCALDYGSNSDKNGGGIYNQGTLIIDNSLITLNKAIRLGGGIYNADNSNVTVTDSIFTHNAGISGGGIFNNHDNQLTITNSTFSYNSAYGECNCGGGGIYAYDGADISITNSTISNNFADGFGGGIYARLSKLTIVDSTVSDNTAFASGGGIYHNNYSPASNIIRSTIDNNYASDYGGGIFHQGGEINLTDSVISNNYALDGGGGIDVRSSTTITESTISDNTTDLYGAGIRSAYGSNPLTLSNSTVYGNSSLYRGGGFSLTGSSLTTLHNTTVANNSAVQDGGGMFVDNGAVMAIANSIIADSLSGGDCWGTLNFAGMNLIEDDTCNASTNGQLTGDPKLDPVGLQLNTGSVPTVPLLSDSPAIDVGDNAEANGLTYDQRGVGYPRIYGTQVDLGAYEYQPISATNTPSPTPSSTITPYPTPTATSTLFGISATAPSLTPSVTFTPSTALPPTATATSTFTLLPTPTDIPTSPGFVVNTMDDTLGECTLTYCTLRSAIDAANQQLGPNIIYLPAGTIQMQLAGRYEDNNQTGDYDVTDTLTIIGHVSGTTLDAANLDRHFELYGVFDFTLENMTVINAELPYLQVGDLTTDRGGVINADFGDTITLNNIVARDNIAHAGNVIHSNYADQVIVNDSRFEQNHSHGGAVIMLKESPIQIENSEFINNSGGALVLSGHQVAQINDTTFRDNYGVTYGGAIYGSARLFIDNSIFDGNSAESGGAIRSNYPINVTNSVFLNNYAESVGGAILSINVSSDDSVIENSAIINNTAGINAGGIFGRDIRIENTTIAGNVAGVDAGGGYFRDDVSLVNTTIVDNTAGTSGSGLGGGIYIYNVSTFSRIQNSIIANNTDSSLNSGDCYGRPNEVQNSLIEKTIYCHNPYNVVSDSIFGEDPNLSVLQSTYYDLLPGSPAINQASDTYCAPTDQLGNSRPIGVYCDMGAVESPYTLNPPTNLTGTVVSYEEIALTWTDNSPYDQSVVVERSLDGVNWTEIATLPADAESYTDIGLNCPQSYYYRVSSRTVNYSEESNNWMGTISSPCGPLKFLTSISASAVDQSTAQITWTDDNTDESGYRIMRRVSDTWSQIGVVPPNLTSFNDTTIQCQFDVTYDYQIQAYRDIDSTTANSTIASIWTGDCPFYPPTSFNISGVTDAQVDLMWLDNSLIESAYIVSRSVDNVNWSIMATLPVNTASFTDTVVECERTYYYRLQGYQGLFDRYSNSASLSATTDSCNVTIPDTITTTVASNQTSLSWNPIPPQQTTQMIVERAEQDTNLLVGLSVDQGLAWQVKATLPGGINVFTDDDLRCGMSYWYRIQGYNERYNEYTAYSDLIQVITAECPVPVTNTVGLYQDGRWMFRDGFDNSAQIITFRFGPQEAGWIPLTGDWDGDGVDGIGIYKDGVFALRNVSERGVNDYVYRFGNRESGWQPIVGDWNGDGQDTVGLYRNGMFMLTNSHESPEAHHQFVFGSRENGWIAITGDWDAGGRDFVGLYKDGVFQLHDSFKTQSSGQFFRFGPDTGDWTPITGDWDADGITTIGVYKDSSWRFRNSNSRGSVDIGFTFGHFNGIAYPLASYRGGKEAIEALAFVSEMPLPDVDASSAEQEPVTVTPTQVIQATVNPTVVGSTPTITESVSSTETQVEPTVTGTPTSEWMESYTPTIEPTVDGIETNIPTMTLTATDEPTIEPTATAVPTATTEPTSIPTSTLVTPESTQQQDEAEVTAEVGTE